VKLERRVESGVVELELEHRGRKVVVAAFVDDRTSVPLRNFDKP
jgi:uncharacterized membrane protein